MAVSKLKLFVKKKSIRAESLPDFEMMKVLGVSNQIGITVTNHKKSKDLSKYQLIEEGDFAYNPYRINVGSIGLVPKGLVGLVSPAYVVFKTKNLIPELLLDFLKSNNGLFQIGKYARGTVRKALRFEDLCQIEMQIPNMNKQESILLKKQSIDRETFVLKTEFTHQQTLLKKLRQQILQEAIEGKLTADWRKKNPDVEPASELLKRIQAEKAQLIKDKKIRKGKKQITNELVNNNLEIPNVWELPDMDDICLYITDGTHQTPSYTQSGRIFLSAQNVKPFRFMPEIHRYVSEDDYSEYVKNRKTEKGDLLLGRVGAGIGETAVVDRDIDCAIYVSLGLVKTFKNDVNSQYLEIVFNSPYGVRYSKGNISSTGAAGNYNLGRIRSFPIPLPPLSEQKAIVTKVEKLLTLCDQLESQITSNQSHAEQLMQAVLKEAFSQDTSQTESVAVNA